MTDSKYFGIPFGSTGDRATIPEATDASGYVSYQQGFGPDYERDPATDPLAKRVPRDETNEYLYQITNALKYIQLYGLPEWYDEDAAGNPVSYPQGAQVRHNAGSGMTAWLSIAAANTAEPGTDATKWVLASGYSWQHVSKAIEAVGLTPNPADTSQMSRAIQSGGLNYVVAGGTANALTASLSPTCLSLKAGLSIRVNCNLANTSGAATLKVDGLGAKAIYRRNDNYLAAGDIRSGINEFVYDGTYWRIVTPAFTGSALGQSGLVDFAGGVTMQWGNGTTSSGGTTVTFPRAFSEAAWVGVATDSGAGSWGPSGATLIGVFDRTATTMQVRSIAATSGGSFAYSVASFTYIAIGRT